MMQCEWVLIIRIDLGKSAKYISMNLGQLLSHLSATLAQTPVILNKPEQYPNKLKRKLKNICQFLLKFIEIAFRSPEWEQSAINKYKYVQKMQIMIAKAISSAKRRRWGVGVALAVTVALTNCQPSVYGNFQFFYAVAIAVVCVSLFAVADGGP